MLVQNTDIGAVFREIADLLEIRGENPFRIRAYRTAARTLDNIAPSVQVLLEQHRDLDDLPGVGPDLAGKIGEIVATGTCALREELRGGMPEGISLLLSVPGLGPKRVKTLYQELGVGSVEQLAAAARSGAIAGVPGFGSKTAQRILEAIEARQSKATRFGIGLATGVVEPLLAWLEAGGLATHLAVAGSYRRRQDTVGDLDIVASCRNRQALLERFAGYGEVAQVISHGATRASVRLRQGMAVDMRVVAGVSYGSALHYFTGSKAHNIALRRIAMAQGYKLNEYGLFDGTRRMAGATEASVFHALGLPFIEPELRENRGEIEAAQAGRLPRLVALGDLRGDLHVHTRAGEGKDSLREMAMAAQARGLAYLAITDSAHSLGRSHAAQAGALARQADEIDAMNAGTDRFVLLKGIEVGIGADGRLDLPDELLRKLDVVVGAVHTAFDLPREQQTARILRALDHPCLTVLAHPAGRLIGKREPCQLDMLRIVRHAKERGCLLEVNAQPQRLDLNDIYCRAAKEEGAMLCIGSDARGMADFGNLGYGVGQARRGWLECADVANTRKLPALRKLLARTRLA